MRKNIFIVIDGMDGSGKSDAVKLLHNHLFSKKSCRILTTKEPTNGIYGKRIREMLRKEQDPLSNKELLLDLFVKDREEHLKKTIIPFLNSENDEQHIVISDRYYYSTIAFQHTQGLPIDIILNKNKKFVKPDIAFILDVKPDIALKRISKRQKEKSSHSVRDFPSNEKFEKLDFMKKLRKNFLNLKKILKNENIVVVDASRTIDEVFKDIVNEIKPH